MAANYAKHISTRQTPQSEAIPGSNQVQNSAGGFSFEVDDWAKLDRFLILGCEGGSYYASERTLSRENAGAVLKCLGKDGPRVVKRAVEISVSGRAPKNDAAIFVLALALTAGDERTKQVASEAVSSICRIGTHLFQFVENCKQLRGWGRSLKRSVANWYTGKEPRDLAFQVAKYQQRNGWSHRDLLRLSHPKLDRGDSQIVANWITRGWEGVGDQPHDREALLLIWAMERAKRATCRKEITNLIRDYRLPRECVPTNWLNDKDVWAALLEKMPLGAMVRNLGKMTNIGLLTPLSSTAKFVAESIADVENLRRARMHPLNLLVALKTYQQGHGEKGKLSWQAVSQVSNALDAAFYTAFQTVEPTNKRWLLALDVSGSMSHGQIAGMAGITPRIGSAALALVTAATEESHHMVGFSHQLVDVPIHPKMRLDEAIDKVSRIPMGATDCALPMVHALQNNWEVDAFVVLTDNETWNGRIHPVQALKQYRQQMGIPAKLIVCGMVSNNFSIADPNDGGCLDVVGFDTNTPQIMSDFVAGR